MDVIVVGIDVAKDRWIVACVRAVRVLSLPALARASRSWRSDCRSWNLTSSRSRLQAALRPSLPRPWPRPGCPSSWSIRRRCEPLPRRSAEGQDRSDRRCVIAHFAEATKPDPRPLPDKTTRLLADLVARRRQIIEMIGRRAPARAANEQQAFEEEHRPVAKALEKELAELDEDIDDAVRGSPVGERRRICWLPCPALGRPSPAR